MTSQPAKSGIVNTVHLILYLIVPVTWLLTSFVLKIPLPLFYLIVAEAAISAYFYVKHRRLFVPGMFLVIMLATVYIPFPPGTWLINILMAAAMTMALTKAIPTLRRLAIPFPRGHFDKGTIVYSLLIVIVSTIALIIWKALAKPDIRALIDTALNIEPKYILPAIIAFPIFNAIAEEVMFRWILWDGLADLIESSIMVIIVQALVFGLSHHPGFPNGWLGVGMAAVYGLMLGYIRQRSEGLWPPIATHIFADITIVLIVFISAGII